MRRGMQITFVLWILAWLSWLVILSLMRAGLVTHWSFIMLAVYHTMGAGAWTFMYSIFRIVTWASKRDKVEVRCECGHVNLVPTVDLFHAYENVTCEKCGARIQGRLLIADRDTSRKQQQSNKGSTIRA